MPRKIPSEAVNSKQDIRSFFKVKSTKTAEKPSTTKLVLSDDDDIPESPDVQIKTKKKESRRKRVIDDSDDEEIFTTKSKKPKDEKKKIVNGSGPAKKPLKEVKAADIFGSTPIKRTEPIVTKSRKIKTETGIHSDEEFEKSLIELDNAEKIKDESIIEIEDIQQADSPEKKETKSIFFNGKTSTKNADIVVKDEQKKSTELEKYKIPKLKLKEEDVKINDAKVKIEKNTTNEKSTNKAKDISSHKAKNKSPHKAKDKSPNKAKDKSPNKAKDKSPNKATEQPKLDKKRDFSEFIGDEDQLNEYEQESKNKKKKMDKSFNNSVISDEERYERKRHSAALYQSYLNRSGPKNLGSKEIPEGSPDCLKDCAFLLTGVLESFEREEIAEAIAKYGGTVKSGVSKKVTHVLAGDDAGPAKLAKATDLGIKIISEDEFLQMIENNSRKNLKDDSKKDKDKKSSSGTSKREDKSDKSSRKDKSSLETKSDIKQKESQGDAKKRDTKVSPEKIKEFTDKIKNSFYAKSKEKESKTVVEDDEAPCTSKEALKVDQSKDHDSKKDEKTFHPAANSIMWVEKYKPQNVKQIIGQHGDASNVKKLTNWLTKWYVNRKEKIPKPSPWAKNDDGAYYKAALLSGPPGVGKTTTVSLVCKELGFDTVEFNASDTRNKSLIREQIGELLSTNSLSGFAKGETNKKAISKKHVLVMDEVDGMAGNEDRGGLQELISLIKTTSVPIICMCNDRNSEKMRSLVNYCYDLKFSRPRVDQIRAAMLSVCFKEGIKIPTEALNQLIVASNQDVRQTLNSLSLWAADPGNLDPDKLKKDAQNTKKDLKLGAWEAVRKVFSAEDHKTMSIHDKSDLFFYDYSMAPLFVQENYLSVVPHCPKNEILKRISEAADSISAGDLVDAKIRGNQAWSLLPLQAMYSSVIPGSLLSGHVGGQIQFPGWLGKNSRANKMKRLAAELHAHTRLSATGSKSSIFLDYSTHLRDAIVKPLINDRMDGISRSIEVLNSYNLLREDLDSLNELALWPGQRDPMILVDSKVKAAMTRTYNKQAPALPHSGASFSKSRAAIHDADDINDDEDDTQDDGDVETDALIKVKKKPESKSKVSEKASTSKPDKPKKGKGKK